MRPKTLAEAVERIRMGAAQDVALAEFVDTFDLAPTNEARYATIADEPLLTHDKRLNALVGVIFLVVVAVEVIFKGGFKLR